MPYNYRAVGSFVHAVTGWQGEVEAEAGSKHWSALNTNQVIPGVITEAVSR